MSKFYFNLDLDPMTLVYELDLQILKMYLLTEKWSFQVKAIKS